MKQIHSLRFTFPRLTSIVSFCAVMASMAWPVVAHAQWAWRDHTQNNQITYSDTPPPPHIRPSDVIRSPRAQALSSASSPVSVPSNPTQPHTETKPAPPLIDPKLQAARKEAERQAAEEKQKQEAQIAALKAINCENARTKLRTLESGIRVGRVNSKGETEILEDEARQAETKQAQDLIRSQCK